MVVSNYDAVRPGRIEVYAGPVKSGKTRELISRIEPINYLAGAMGVIIRPEVDTRTENLMSRYGTQSKIREIRVCERNPEKIISVLEGLKEPQLGVVAIDEVQFFEKGLLRVVQELSRQEINVVMAGLNLDFKGETFGIMGDLMAMSDEVTILRACCEYTSVRGNCGRPASRSQRLINGKPAHYNAPIISIDGSKQEEKYEARCLEHHLVHGRPD
ncbi:thymidine kinase [Candidatus Pacearchaeota archaeon CG10_big_fil_rev_8_21_14_0_10_35_13]|nr:MAG: thymidine kinase [Candidatus Pacearchaeota archaeon CG10_big_fil_rev_8_21_14_0_10_35_13]